MINNGINNLLDLSNTQIIRNVPLTKIKNGNAKPKNEIGQKKSAGTYGAM